MKKYARKTNGLTAKIDNDNIIKTFKTQAKEPATWLFVWVFLFLKTKRRCIYMVRTFCLSSEIDYREVYLNSDLYYKYYEIDNPNNLDIVGFPDGMIDIQVGLSNGEVAIQFVGSFLEGKIATTTSFERCFGIKLRPDVIPVCLIGKMELLNENMRIDVAELLDIDREMVQQIFEESCSVEKKVEIMSTIVKREYIQKQNEITAYVIDVVNKKQGNVNVADIINGLGYSHRYSDTIFKNNVGFTIKKYARIYRLQEAMNMLVDNVENVCYELGYYDQSHFIHDFKKFSSFTPTAFRNVIGVGYMKIV